MAAVPLLGEQLLESRSQSGQCFIAVMHPVSGPQLLRKSVNAADHSHLTWLANLALSDRDPPLWPEWECHFDVKVTVIDQLQICLMTTTLREHVDDVSKAHMVPMYVVGYTAASVDMHERRIAILSALKDRFSLLAMKMLTSLRDASDDVTAAPLAVVDDWWVDVQQLDTHLRQWLRCGVTRHDAELCALSYNVCRFVGLADNTSPQTTACFMSYLSGALTHRRLIVRGSNAAQVRWWVHALLMFFPDDKLLMCSTECHDSLDDVVPELCLQGTTLTVTSELLRHTLWSQYPVAVLDIDRPLHDAAHLVPPSISESPHEWMGYKKVREGFLVGSLPADAAPKFSLRPWGPISDIVADVVRTVVRIYSSVPRVLDTTWSNDSVTSTELRAATAPVFAHDWQVASRLSVAPAIDRWRRRVKLLACRSLFSELATDVFDVFPKMPPETNDILLNVVNFNQAVEKTKQKVRQVGARFDEF